MSEKLKLFTLAPEACKLDNGESVYLRRMTAADRMAWIDYLSSSTPEQSASSLDIGSRLLSITLCDTEGKRLFAEADVQELKLIDSITFDRLTQEALRINGLSGGAAEEVKKK